MRRKVRRAKRTVPGWLVLLAVIMTAGATGWAMTKTAQGRGWTADPNTPFFPRQATQVMSPAAAAVQNGALPVGAPAAAAPAVPGVPPTIVAGVAPGHQDRGVCTGCHLVVSSRGTPVPQISARAVAPHEVRGVCTNCHAIAVGNPAPAGPGSPWATRPPGAAPLDGAGVATVPAAGQPVGGLRQANPAATCPTQF